MKEWCSVECILIGKGGGNYKYKKLSPEMNTDPSTWDDSNWREEYKSHKLLSKFQLEILENGPRVFLNHGFLVQCMETGER